MKARSAPELLAALRTRTETNLTAANHLSLLDEETLHLRPRPNAWNALECLAHLNHYGDFYHPEIRRRIEAAPPAENVETFTSSWLGNQFAAGMKPGPKTRKVSTFKNANPTNFETAVDRSVITEFTRQQNELLNLLDQAAHVDLTRTKTSISITRFVKIRLGDTLRTVVYHNWRHVEQALVAARISG